MCAALARPSRPPRRRPRAVDHVRGPRDLPTPRRATQRLDEIAALGVQALRIVLYWHGVAPEPDSRVKPSFDDTDPASYDWRPTTPSSRRPGARLAGPAHRLGPVPRWATNGAATRHAPEPRRVPEFVHAVGRHFGNQGRHMGDLERAQPAAVPAAAVHAPRRRVAGDLPRCSWPRERGCARPARRARAHGETSPRGTGKVVAPLTFLRGALCLNSKLPARPPSAARSSPPTATPTTPTRRGQGPTFEPAQPNDVTIGVLGAADPRARPRRRSAGADHRAHAGLPHRVRHPEHARPVVGVSLAQAEYRAISERIAYDNPRVVPFSQYLLRDDLPKAAWRRIARYRGFETGLFTDAGKTSRRSTASACRSPLRGRARRGLALGPRAARRRRDEGNRRGALQGRRLPRR